MEFDLQNPLAIASFKEQQNSTMSELFASESHHLPSPNYLTSLKTMDFLVSFRCEAISLILQKGKPWLLRLIVISCLSLASKMKNTPLSLSDFQEEDFIFEAQSIQKMELLILGTLKWRMRSITPFSFMHFFISSSELKDPSLKQGLKQRASEIFFNAHYEMKFLEFKPSIMAASALISASHELFPLRYSTVKASTSACDYLDKEALSKCSKLMKEMMRIEAKDSIVDLSILSTDTLVGVLERDSNLATA